MVATFVQAVAGTAVTSGKVASAQYGSNVAAGNALFAVVSRTVTGDNSPAATITDDQSNKWKQCGEGLVRGTSVFATDHDHGLDVWYCENAGGGNRPIVTATLQGFPNGVLGRMVVVVLEYAGFSGSFEPYETQGVLAILGTSGTPTTRDSCSANDLLLSVVIHNGSAATVPAGWNSRVNDTTTKFAIADKLDSGSAGAQGAAWTGLTGNTKGYGIIIAFKPAGTKSSGSIRCVRTQYRLEELFAGTAPIGAADSPNFASPAVGNSLILYTSPYVGNNVIEITDDHGNQWEELFDGQFDNWGAGNNSLWICRRAIGSAPTIKIRATLAQGRGDQLWNETLFILMEWANLPADTDVITSGDKVSDMGSGGVGTASISIPTAASVPSGTLCLGLLGGGISVFTGLDNSAGWLTRFNDSGAQISIIEKVTSGAGVQTAAWTWQWPQDASYFVVALGSRSPSSSGIIATQRRAAFTAPDLPAYIGQRAETFEYQVLDSDLNRVGIITPMGQEVSVENNTGNDIIRQLSNIELSEDDCENMNMLTTRIQPIQILDDLSRWPLGVFLFSAADRHPRSTYGASSRTMSMYDQNTLLLYRRREPFGLTRGSSLRNAMIQLVEEVGIVSYFIGASGAVAGDDISWPAATPRLTILRHLCALAGMLRPYFDNNGSLWIKSSPDLESVEPDVSYDTGPASRIDVESIITAQDFFDLPNTYLVKSSGATESEVSVTMYVPSTMPHSVQNVGYERVEEVNLPGLTDTMAGIAAAQAHAAQQYNDFYTYEFEGAPDGRHDTFQIIGIDSVNHREVSWSLPCKSGARHKHSMRLAYSLVQNPQDTAPSGVGAVIP